MTDLSNEKADCETLIQEKFATIRKAIDKKEKKLAADVAIQYDLDHSKIKQIIEDCESQIKQMETVQFD